MPRSPWHCTACGGEAEYLSSSLDPRHPLGRCQETVGPYAKPAHGGHPVPISMDPDELALLLAVRREAQLRAAHNKHIRDRLVAGCKLCQAMRERARPLFRHAQA